MTHSSKSSAYSRFIPREEIDAVSAWRFANVDGTPHPDEVVEEPPPPPPAPSPEAIAADMEALRRQSYEEGYADGHQAGCEETREQLAEPHRIAVQEATQRFDAVLKEMREQLAQAQEQMAQTLLEMTCNLARQVIRRELSTDAQTIAPVITEALGLLVSDTLPVTVRLHPDDFAALEAGWSGTPESGSPRFVPDPAITRGGCRVEAPGNAVNATLEKRWAKAVANLGIASDWNEHHDTP